MNGRERLTAAFRGKKTDRVPWVPLIFHDTLGSYPARIREAGPIEFTRMIGGDVLWRVGSCRLENEALKTKAWRAGGRLHLEYRTPVGNLHEVRRESGQVTFRVERYPVESLDDFRVLEHIIEQQEPISSYDEVEQLDQVVGDDGILMDFESTSPLQSLVQQWMGLKGFYSHMLRHKSELDGLISLMHEGNRRIYEIMAEAPVEVACAVENTDIRLAPPRFYREHSRQHMRDFVEIMHRKGKIAVIHMCGKIDGLLTAIKETGLDAIDCLTPPPTGDVRFSRAYDVFGDDFVIHGVLNPGLWTTGRNTTSEVGRSIAEILEEVGGRPFMLCTAADGLPGIPIETFKGIGRIMTYARH